MVWISDGEKKFEDTFIRFDRIHEREGRTDGRTDGQTPHDGIAALIKLCIVLRCKNKFCCRREVARCFVSLKFAKSLKLRSFKVIRNYTGEYVCEVLLVIHRGPKYVSIL